MRDEGGYRDETASLVHENARLRAELARIRRPRRWLGASAGLVVADAVLAMALRPWFNGASDARFWAACILVAGVAIGAAACAGNALPHRGV